MLEYHYQACIPKVKEKIVDMAINGAGIWDTVRVLNVSKATVIKTLKGKEACLVQVNPNIKNMELSADSEISLKQPWAENAAHPKTWKWLKSLIELHFHGKLACDAAEIDEQWSFCLLYTSDAADE